MLVPPGSKTSVERATASGNSSTVRLRGPSRLATSPSQAPTTASSLPYMHATWPRHYPNPPGLLLPTTVLSHPWMPRNPGVANSIIDDVSGRARR